jgi:hypothetical protein
MKGEKSFISYGRVFILFAFLSLAACATTRSDTYVDPNMDFGIIKTVAVMPLGNLTRDNLVSERVRDVLIHSLLATGAIYVLPPGEVAKAVVRAEIQNPAAPSSAEVVKFGEITKVQAVITGVVREYGEVRSGATFAPVVSIGLQMIETETGKTVWTASSTRGGVTVWHRLFGGGGEPMNVITEKAVNDLINKLFK